MATTTAALREISLLEIPAAGSQPRRLALEIEGDLNGVDLLIGAGSAPDIDQFLEQDPLDQSLRQSSVSASAGVWFGTGMDAVVTNGIPDRPVWLAVLRERKIDLFGIQPLAPASGAPLLRVPGVLDLEGACVLRTRISAQGTTIRRADCTLDGDVRLRADLGPVQINNATGRFHLVFNALSIDDAWTGALTCTLDVTGSIQAFGATIAGQQTLTLSAQCQSAAHSRDFGLSSIAYSHTAATVQFGGSGVALANLELHAQIDTWDSSGIASLAVLGRGSITLPAFLNPVIDSATVVNGEVALSATRQGSVYSTTFDAQLNDLRLKPAVNPLAFRETSLHLHIENNDAWIEASTVQSWTQIARQLRTARVVDLPDAAGLPDLRCRLRIELAGSTAKATLELSLRMPGRDLPFTGRLWVLPVVAEAWQIRLIAPLPPSNAQWTAEGSGRISTIDPLQPLVPLTRAQISFALVGAALRLTVSGGLPQVTLPPLTHGAAGLQLVQPISLSLFIAADARVTLQVRLLQNLGAIAAPAGLPASWDGFLRPLITAVQGATGELAISLPFRDDGALQLRLAFTAPQNAAAFDPLQAFARILPTAPPPSSEPSASHPSPPLLTITPSLLEFTADIPASGAGTLQLGGSVICSVGGETFDANLIFAIRQGVPEVTLLAAHRDPILIPIPSPGTGALLATIDADLDRVLSMYAITAGARRDQMFAVRDQLEAVFGDTTNDVIMAFEIVDLAIAFRADAARDPFSISGGIRVVQYPPILDALLGGSSPTLKIGTSGTSVFVEITAAGAEPAPLFSIPVADKGDIKVFLHNLRVGYRWDPPAVEFTLSSEIQSPTVPFRGGVGLLLPPASSIDVDISAPTPPPFPIPQWRADFLGQNRAPDQRGIQLVFGAADPERWLTIYLRETILSPTFYFLMPGLKIDGGAYLGRPPGARGPTEFHCEFRLGGGQWITINPVMGLMLNPLAALPPFLTATPPFWFIPPSLMGDFFTDSTGATGLELSANIPFLAGFEVTFKRPLPNISLQMILEVAALAAQNFAVELPATSALSALFYAGLEGRVTLHLLDTLFGAKEDSIPVGIRFNIVDLINSVLRMVKLAREAVTAGAGAAQKAADFLTLALSDPEAIVRMVPRNLRGFSLDTALAVPGLEFACSLSAYLLLPDELEAELDAYHENKRKKGKGLGALREAPGGAGRPAVDFGGDIFDRITLLKLENAAAVFGNKTQGKISALARAKLAQSTAGAIPKIKTEVATKLAARLVNELIHASRPADRQRLVRQYGLEGAIPEIERTLHAPPPRLNDALAAIVVDEVLSNGRFDIEILAVLPVDASVIARQIVDTALDVRPGAVPTLKGGRRQSIDTISGARSIGRRLDRALDDLVAARTPTRPLTSRDIDGWKRDTAKALEPEIESARKVGSQSNVPATGFGEAVLDAAHPAFGMDDFPLPDVRSRETHVPIFRSVHWNKGLAAFFKDRWRPGALSPISGQAEGRDGFVIRLRKDKRDLAPNFQMRVPSRTARFNVRLQDGAYRIAVPGLDPQALPAAVVNSLPPSRERARKLREMLVIEESRSTRALTQSEKDYLNHDPYITVDGLYQSTLFARPDYQIKPTGGVRGSTSLADVLRSSNGTYDIPDGPCAIAGAMVHLKIGGLSFDAQFCGYCAPGSSNPRKDPMMLLFAHSEQSIVFGDFSLDLKGDFHLLAGRSSVNAGGEVIPQGMALSGSGAIYFGGRKLVHGSVKSTSAVKSGARLHLGLDISLHFDIVFDDIGIAGFDLAKGRLEQDLVLKVTVDSRLRVECSADVTFHYQTTQVTWKNRTHRVCAGIGPFHHCESVTIPEPETSWGPEQGIDAHLSVTLDTSTQNPEFKATVTVPGLNLTLAVPDFLTPIV